MSKPLNLEKLNTLVTELNRRVGDMPTQQVLMTLSTDELKQIIFKIAELTGFVVQINAEADMLKGDCVTILEAVSNLSKLPKVKDELAPIMNLAKTPRKAN